MNRLTILRGMQPDVIALMLTLAGPGAAFAASGGGLEAHGYSVK
jgi:hypothetical protein